MMSFFPRRTRSSSFSAALPAASLSTMMASGATAHQLHDNRTGRTGQGAASSPMWTQPAICVMTHAGASEIQADAVHLPKERLLFAGVTLRGSVVIARARAAWPSASFHSLAIREGRPCRRVRWPRTRAAPVEES